MEGSGKNEEERDENWEFDSVCSFCTGSRELWNLLLKRRKYPFPCFVFSQLPLFFKNFDKCLGPV